MDDPKLEPTHEEPHAVTRRSNQSLSAKPSDILDNAGLPHWLRIVAAIIVILVSIYPAYLGIATLMEKREESRRESEIHLKQMADEESARREQYVREEKERREQELELAKSKERESKLKLDQIQAEANAELAKLRLEIDDKTAQRKESQENASAEAQRKEDELFQEDVQKLLSLTTSQEETEARIALLSRHLAPGVPEYRRSTIIAALSTKLQVARSPQEVDAIFTILVLAGQHAFPAVVRANQDAFSAVYGAMIADNHAHLNFSEALRNQGVSSTNTQLDIANAFGPQTVSWSSLIRLNSNIIENPEKRPPIGDEAAKAARNAHETFVVQLSILSASREAIAALLPTVESPGIALDRCFIPEMKLVGNKNLANISIRHSYLESADLRGLGTTDILIQNPVYYLSGEKPLAPSTDVWGELNALKVNFYLSQHIKLVPTPAE
jgi:hypothetical protein